MKLNERYNKTVSIQYALNEYFKIMKKKEIVEFLKWILYRKKIQGKWLRKGDEYWYIQKEDNYKLGKMRVGEEVVGNEKFLTKKSALEYVLKEANRRFKKGCEYYRAKHDDKGHVTELSISENWPSNDKKGLVSGCIHDIKNRDCVWTYELGFIAEPIKEKPLTLGGCAVRIRDVGTSESGKLIVSKIVECEGESVTAKEWLDWNDIFFKIKDICSDFAVHLGSGYTTSCHEGESIKIGCIYDVTIEEIKNITAKLKK
jgi:hypothetical protein